MSPRSRQILYYGLPMLFCLVVHWLALKIWFFGDDFAWLGLRLELHTPRDLIHVLFSPQAEGTVRTFSERLFFLVFSSVFGLESPPFRIWVFLTQFANIALLIQIARRLTGSATAGFLAALLWTANAGIALAISWSSAYNEIAEAFFILLAFRLFLAYINTGKVKYWIWQWAVFLLGFGALELNVVYPAIVAGYALCCARQHFRRTLYLFIPSALFTMVHLFLIPTSTDEHYKMYLGSSLFTMLWKYWAFAIGAVRDSQTDWRPLWLGIGFAMLATAGLAAFVYRKLRTGEWTALFLAVWFVIVLTPLLPFKNHFTEYYVIVPAIGLSILAAWAIASSRQALTLGVAAALAVGYFTLSIADDHMAEKYHYNNSRRMKYLIKGLESQQKLHPREVVLLSGIDNDLFWSGFCDNPFRLLGIYHTYVVPASAKAIQPHPEWGCDTSRFFVNVDDAVPLLRNGHGGVFDLEGRSLRDITQQYLKTVAAEYAERHPDFIDISDPMFQNRLGPTWYPAERGYRWMPKRATLKIHGPTKQGQVLEASGYCPAAVLAQGPLQVSFRTDGIALGTSTLTQPDQLFALKFPWPAEFVGRPMVELEIEVSRTLEPPGETRPLGLVFTTFTIK
jgi:multidrug transporter EmrE-like cation transporter